MNKLALSFLIIASSAVGAPILKSDPYESSRPAYFEVRVDGSDWVRSIPREGKRGPFLRYPMPELSIGLHTIEARACDTFGLCSEIAVLRVTRSSTQLDSPNICVRR